MGDHAIPSKLSSLVQISNWISNQVLIFVGIFGVGQRQSGVLGGSEWSFVAPVYLFLWLATWSRPVEQVLAVGDCLSAVMLTNSDLNL